MLALIVPLLYGLCFVLFGGLVLFIAYHGRQLSSAPSAQLRRMFFLLILSLLIWQVTYLSEASVALPAIDRWGLLLGRANFVAIAFAVFLAWRFVAAVAEQHIPSWLRRACLAETLLIAAITLFTALVDAAEGMDAESLHPTTRYGSLFPLYLLHVLGYLAAALTLATRSRQNVHSSRQGKQLALIGFGICVTGSIALITNAMLPYLFGEFGLCDGGTLATLFFVLAVAYAVFVHGLFDLRVVLRETLVYGILLAFVLGGYSSAAFLLTEYLTKGADRMTEFAVLLIAFTLDPLRRWLEKKVDKMLFGR